MQACEIGFDSFEDRNLNENGSKQNERTPIRPRGAPVSSKRAVNFGRKLESSQPPCGY